ncbi:MAG: glycosyltransferase family 2 protein, partial [Bradyrhizobium sp.]
MPQTPKVSIIMPVYNGANYMRQAIDSALAQTWPSIEIIVIDDGSTDGGETDRIARSYGDRIRHVKKRNGGVASALNAGIDIMTGDFFCWLSHDDLYVPSKTERQVARWTALGCPGDVVLYTDYALIDATGAPIADVVLDHEMLEEKPLYSVLRGSIHGCSVFVPRHLFDQAGKFDTRRPTTQDY